jgi:hypothetical protein
MLETLSAAEWVVRGSKGVAVMLGFEAKYVASEDGKTGNTRSRRRPVRRRDLGRDYRSCGPLSVVINSAALKELANASPAATHNTV